MKNLVYFFIFLIFLPSCIKDEDKAPDTTDLPKRITTAILYEYLVESQRIDYSYNMDKLVKAELYTKSSSTGEWEMVNELNYDYDLPKVTLTVKYNWLGTWTETAKIEYVIENDQIQQMDDYTNFYDAWRHDVSTSYTYSNGLLTSYVKENLSQDTVSYAKKLDYTYIDGFTSQAKEYYLVDGAWSINEYLNWEYIVGGTGGYRVLGFDADSIANSKVSVISVNGLTTKKETYLNAVPGDPLELDKIETFEYYQNEYLTYSDLQTDGLFQYVDYYYENAEGNAAWFSNPEDILEATPRPKGPEIVNSTLSLMQKGR